MRVLCYAINGVGLGHVRRLLLIAKEIQKKDSSSHILFVTNSSFPQMIEEAGFPCVRIPSNKSPQVNSHFPLRTIPGALHDKLFATALEDFAPDAVVFDGSWSPQLLGLVKKNDAKSVLILRKGSNDQLQREKKDWKHFDLLCVSHSKKDLEGLGTPESIISDLNKQDALFAGPIVSTQKGIEKQSQKSSPFRILVSAGGGGWHTTQKFLDDVSAGLQDVISRNLDIKAEIITGPLFQGKCDVEGARLHTYLPNEDLQSLMKRSDLAITQAGYNTCNELLAARLPSILVPASREVESQRERALFLENHGCSIVSAGKDLPKMILQLYGDRNSLSKMQENCEKTLGNPGTPSIARSILRLVKKTQVEINLNEQSPLPKTRAVIIARGKPTKQALENISKLSKGRKMILEGDLSWLDKEQKLASLKKLSAFILPLTRVQAQQLVEDKGETKLSKAVRLLVKKGPYFEVRVPLSKKLLPHTRRLIERLRGLGTPQIHLSMGNDVVEKDLEQPLSDLRMHLLENVGSDRFSKARIYCSSQQILVGEFPARRIKEYELSKLRRKLPELTEDHERVHARLLEKEKLLQESRIELENSLKTCENKLEQEKTRSKVTQWLNLEMLQEATFQDARMIDDTITTIEKLVRKARSIEFVFESQEWAAYGPCAKKEAEAASKYEKCLIEAKGAKKDLQKVVEQQQKRLEGDTSSPSWRSLLSRKKKMEMTLQEKELELRKAKSSLEDSKMRRQVVVREMQSAVAGLREQKEGILAAFENTKRRLRSTKAVDAFLSLEKIKNVTLKKIKDFDQENQKIIKETQQLERDVAIIVSELTATQAKINETEQWLAN